MGKGPTRRQGAKKSARKTGGDGGRSAIISECGLGAWRPRAATFKTGRDRTERPKHKKQTKQDWNEG